MNADLNNIHPLFLIEYFEHTSGEDMTNYHYHTAYELYFLEQGYHNVLVNDSILDVAAYDVLLYRPNTFHKSIRRKGCIRTCIYFTDRFLHLYFTDPAISSLLRCFETELITLNKEIFPKVKKIMLLLEKEDVNNPNNRIFIYLADILNILNDNRNSFTSDHVPSVLKNLSPILSYINQNYSKINNIEDISNQFYISKFYLCHIFKESTGITLIQYLNKIRIQNACSLLIRTNRTISDIGAACGFNSSMYFCKIFKRVLSVTPSEFRKNTFL